MNSEQRSSKYQVTHGSVTSWPGAEIIPEEYTPQYSCYTYAIHPPVASDRTPRNIACIAPATSHGPVTNTTDNIYVIQKRTTMNELERFEKDLYQEEKAEFMSNKCGHCMSYTDDAGNCTNNFCEGLWRQVKTVTIACYSIYLTT